MIHNIFLCCALIFSPFSPLSSENTDSYCQRILTELSNDDYGEDSDNGQMESSVRLSASELIVSDAKKAVYYAHFPSADSNEICCLMLIRTAEVNLTPREILGCSHLYGQWIRAAVDRAVNKDEYPELYFFCNCDSEGVAVLLSGLASNQDVSKLLREILKQIKTAGVINEKQLESLKKDSIEAKDFGFMEKNPALREAYVILPKGPWESYMDEDEWEKLINEVTYKQLAKYSEKLLNTTFIEAVITGGLNKQSALNICKEMNIGAKPLSYSDKSKAVKKKASSFEGKGPLYVESKVDSSEYSGLFFIEYPLESIKDRVIFQMLLEAFEDSYNKTSTPPDVQDTYNLAAIDLWNNNYPFLLFSVMGKGGVPAQLLCKFKHIVDHYLQHFDTAISEKRFNRLKTRLIRNEQNQGTDLFEAALNLFAYGFICRDLSYSDKNKEALEKLTYSEFCEGVGRMLGERNRRKLAIFIEGTDNPKNGS